jgi:hypothetical protein
VAVAAVQVGGVFVLVLEAAAPVRCVCSPPTHPRRQRRIVNVIVVPVVVPVRVLVLDRRVDVPMTVALRELQEPPRQQVEPQAQAVPSGAARQQGQRGAGMREFSRR